MTDFIPMPEPTDEDEKFWEFYEMLRAKAEEEMKARVMLLPKDMLIP